MENRELKTITLELGSKEIGLYKTKKVEVPYPMTDEEYNVMYRKFVNEVLADAELEG